MILDHLTQAFTQATVAVVLSAIVFGVSKIILRAKVEKVSFFKFTGLHLKGFESNPKFLFALSLMVALGISTTLVQFYFLQDASALLRSESSPYFKILKSGLSFQGVVAGILYCFISAGFSEELLFRGLIAKRLVHLCGLWWGNIIQAVIFWLPHLLLVRWVTGEWLSLLQVVTFTMVMFIGLLACYWNESESKGSIFPACMFHGFANFATFLTLAVLL